MAEYWRIEQVAVHFDVSANTVRRWIAAGRLRAVRAGGLRVPVAEVQRFAAESEWEQQMRALDKSIQLERHSNPDHAAMRDALRIVLGLGRPPRGRWERV